MENSGDWKVAVMSIVGMAGSDATAAELDKVMDEGFAI